MGASQERAAFFSATSLVVTRHPGGPQGRPKVHPALPRFALFFINTASTLGPTLKRTEGPAPVWGSEFTPLQGGFSGNLLCMWALAQLFSEFEAMGGCALTMALAGGRTRGPLARVLARTRAAPRVGGPLDQLCGNLDGPHRHCRRGG